MKKLEDEKTKDYEIKNEVSILVIRVLEEKD